jgi:sugar phosphate isomerase/epimerase
MRQCFADQSTLIRRVLEPHIIDERAQLAHAWRMIGSGEHLGSSLAGSRSAKILGHAVINRSSLGTSWCNFVARPVCDHPGTGRDIVRVGIYSLSISRGADSNPFDVLDDVNQLGLAGCQFASPLDLSPDLDPAELQTVRSHAARHGLFVDVALGQIHPYHFESRPEVLALGNGSPKIGFQRLIEAARTVDCTEIMFTIGTVADRFSVSVTWEQQLHAATAFLRTLAPQARDLACHLCLKTHEEITSFEIARIADALGPDVLSVCFDPVNLLVRLEDPLSAARRLAPLVRQVQLDDALIAMTARGLERWLVPCGSGVIDWPAILALLGSDLPDVRGTIELHRAFFDMPIFEPTWLAAQPELTVSELVSVLRLVRESEGRPFAKDFQMDPVSRLEPTLAYLRHSGSGSQ